MYCQRSCSHRELRFANYSLELVLFQFSSVQFMCCEEAFTPQPQSITTLWPVLIKLNTVPRKANSHRRARHDKTVLSVSRPLRQRELNFRQLNTVADRKFEVSTRSQQWSYSHRHTRHDRDSTVLSCLVRRRELGIRVGGVSAVSQSRTAAVGGRGDMRTAVLIVLSR